MQKPTLIIMAAGLGSRYGGLKQISPVDAEGHIIMDFSVFDARRAGFEDVVFVIKPELEENFRAAIGDRVSRFVNAHYAYQTLDRLPEGFSVPEGRVKPWGTAHAAMCAAEYVDGPFAVINADDFYGAGAFRAVYDFLCAGNDENEHAMVAYRIENTLTENGSVARGICREDSNGCLAEIVERTHVEPREGGAAFTEDGEHFTFVPAGTPVSMQVWGFRKSMMGELEAQFQDFLREELPKDPLKKEYFLPSVPNRVIAEGRGRVKILRTADRWFGVTYKEDMPKVRASIEEMKERGEYPRHLWKEEGK